MQVAERRQRRVARAARAAAVRRRAPASPTASCSWPPAAGRPAAAAVSASSAELNRLERLHHALADAARRHVDDAPQADVVVRIEHQPQVGERVLDFLALVEPDAADDLVGDAGAAQRVFDRARLRVGAIQDRDRVLDVVVQRRRGDGARDELGLVEVVAGPVVEHPRAARALGVEPLLLAVAVLGDDRRGGVEDHLRRAVVPLELARSWPRESRARSRGCCAGRRRATCRSTGPGRRRRTDCGGARPAAGSAGTAAGSCPGTRRPSRSGTCSL